MWFDGDDDDKNGTKDEPMGGPEVGNYTDPDVPGQTDPLPNSAQ